ncbi:Hypothetical protein NTJ_12422 [Nesidiocoris tenuis]|uniref:Uncharacterized protein n=1 Tax=Nesidiocoris tenuis TaxID=355587 RepID=A0ABN7B5C0_9HEMI|nr:Hypothetical protein NTJ_12422 [Nesidiocoris tenuis]
MISDSDHGRRWGVSSVKTRNSSFLPWLRENNSVNSKRAPDSRAGHSKMRQSNPGRQKIYLVDVEHAKKEEFERRKKLRLQQVRQQAREIASLIRNRANQAQKKREELKKQHEAEAGVRSANTLRKELQQKFSECLSSVGTAHNSAAALSEVDELVQDKVALQDSLARVRGALANEKSKENRLPRREIVKNPSQGVTISRVTNVQPVVRASYGHRMSQKETRSERTALPATPPDFVGEPTRQRVAGPDRGKFERNVENDVFCPPMLHNRPKPARPNSQIKVSDGRRSCPPRTESFDDTSSDSDDSSVTWPPASVRKKRSTKKVRLYDHTEKKCSQYVQQTGVVRSEMDELPHDMSEMIRDEEELHVKKAEQLSERRQIELERGLRAIREEVAKQDFDSAIRDLCHFSKESRYRKARQYPNIEADSPPRPADTRPILKQTTTEKLPTPQEADVRPPVSITHQPVSSLVSRLIQQREALLKDSSVDETSCSEDTTDKSLPWWVKSQLEAEMGEVPEIDGSARLPTPETVVGRLNAEGSSSGSSAAEEAEVTKDGGGISETPISASDSASHVAESQAADSRVPESRASGTQVPSPANFTTPRLPRKRVEFERVSDSSTDKSNGSQPSAGINVRIKISRDQSRPAVQATQQTPVPERDSSTSYYSPPEKLSPAQLSVLSDILSKMSVRNHNPVLRHYITRLLNMSRQSLSDVDVSSCSEVTVDSDLFPQQPPDTVDCRDSSVAGTASSVPQSPGSPASIGRGQFAQIAGLLRNIFELQRICDSHTSSSIDLSDSRSSYREVPGRVESRILPQAGTGFGRNDDTGLFDDHYAGAQRLLATLAQGRNVRIDVPPTLLPRPFSDSSSGSQEPHDDRIPPETTDKSSHSDEPKSKVHSLSDIESIISSVQSTPTKHISSSQRQDISVISELLSGELMSSREMRDNSLIDTLSSSTSTSDLEEVFRSLGLGWALSTLRRMKNSRRLQADSSSKSPSSSNGGQLSSAKSSYHHSTPVKEAKDATPQRPPGNEAVPSLTPPDVALQCPSWKKSSN